MPFIYHTHSIFYTTVALLDVPLETAQKVINTNLFGVIRLVNLVGPRMVKRGKGVIVPIGSINGELPCPFMGMYNASKAAIHAYTETLTNELKPFGIHVMLVSPGAVKSKIASVSPHPFLWFGSCTHDAYSLFKER
jgi:1-acylglycerone phosphate reductase